jgi:regulator of protease activity HflC (stomatin/prohibitin superfamily)
MKTEKSYSPMSGYLMLFLCLLGAGFSVFAIIKFGWFLMLLPGVFFLFLLLGLFVVNPNVSMVLVLFGKYVGTVKKNGFFWVNPFYTRKKISLRARNLDSAPIKVNDKLANPVMIGVVVVWRVKDTFKAAFDVDDYEHFVHVQSEAAIRKLAGSYAYDNFDDDEQDICLRAGGDEIDHQLEQSLEERVAIAGIEIMEARINYLAYAEEIAQAMLKRQQATAIIAARRKIVEGAVGMVEMALQELSAKEIIDLDDDKKAAMVSNLMVVLTSDKDTSPVVNTGTLYQ